MKGLENYLNKYQTKQKGPAHEQAAKVDEIIKVVGKNDRYPYGFWLRKVKKFSYGQILAMCKEASNLNSKYSKGGFLTNKLCHKTNTTK